MPKTLLNEREYRNRETGRLNHWSKISLAILFILTVGVNPLRAEPQRTVVNLRGDQVLIPTDVPPKERFVLQRLVSVADRLVVFLYRDPKFRRPVDYAETYNLTGELLEIAWYEPNGGLVRARDVNLGDPKAPGPARVLEIHNGRSERDWPSGEVRKKEKLLLQRF